MKVMAVFSLFIIFVSVESYYSESIKALPLDSIFTFIEIFI